MPIYSATPRMFIQWWRITSSKKYIIPKGVKLSENCSELQHSVMNFDRSNKFDLYMLFWVQLNSQRLKSSVSLIRNGQVNTFGGNICFAADDTLQYLKFRGPLPIQDQVWAFVKDCLSLSRKQRDYCCTKISRKKILLLNWKRLDVSGVDNNIQLYLHTVVNICNMFRCNIF